MSVVSDVIRSFVNVCEEVCFRKERSGFEMTTSKRFVVLMMKIF